MVCNASRKTILFLVLNAMLLGGGILLIIFACSLSHNWWGLLMLLFFGMASFFPLVGGSYKIEEHDDPTKDELGPMLMWFLASIFVGLGYVVSIELIRKGIFGMASLWMSVSGGTAILCAVVVFVKIVFYSDPSDYYSF